VTHELLSEIKVVVELGYFQCNFFNSPDIEDKLCNNVLVRLDGLNGPCWLCVTGRSKTTRVSWAVMFVPYEGSAVHGART
jgi:hypothetical protein